MKRILSTWVVVGLIGVAVPVHAGDVYVSVARGKKANPGTKEAPKKSLALVLQEAKEGDRIYVAEGVHEGKSDSGAMPRSAVSNLVIEGGWRDDFGERDPFQYLTTIAPPPTAQGTGEPAFDFSKPDNKIANVTIDGFLIDRAPHNYYFGDRAKPTEPVVEGHQDNTCWGMYDLNKKKSPGVPTINLVGDGSFTVRNCVLVNNAYIGIYVKCGGTGETLIENNLVFITMGRGIEAIMGGGWGDPTIRIRNNTVLFGHTLKSTEGHGLAVDQYARYGIENNVIGFHDGGGVNSKFAPKNDRFTMNGNLFFFNKWKDYTVGGSPSASVADFEDELSFTAEENECRMPAALNRVVAAWFELYCQQKSEVDMVTEHVSFDQLNEVRQALGLEPKADLKSLQGWRQTTMSRYPRAMKKGESMDWREAILGMVGADAPRGILPYAAR